MGEGVNFRLEPSLLRMWAFLVTCLSLVSTNLLVQVTEFTQDLAERIGARDSKWLDLMGDAPDDRIKVFQMPHTPGQRHETTFWGFLKSQHPPRLSGLWNGDFTRNCYP